MVAGNCMNKFPKILNVYFSPFFAFLLYCIFSSPDELNKLLPRVFGRAYAIYMIVGIVVIPILLYGLPSVASIKAEMQSNRVRQGVKRKFQTVLISVALLVIVGLTGHFVPPRDARSLTINIVVFFAMFSLLIWAHFRRKSD